MFGTSPSTAPTVRAISTAVLTPCGCASWRQCDCEGDDHCLGGGRSFTLYWARRATHQTSGEHLAHCGAGRANAAHVIGRGGGQRGYLWKADRTHLARCQPKRGRRSLAAGSNTWWRMARPTKGMPRNSCQYPLAAESAWPQPAHGQMTITRSAPLKSATGRAIPAHPPRRLHPGPAPGVGRPRCCLERRRPHGPGPGRLIWSAYVEKVTSTPYQVTGPGCSDAQRGGYS